MLRRYLKHHAVTLLASSALLGLGSLLTMVLLAYTNKVAANGIPDSQSALLYAAALLLGLLLTTACAQVILARLGAALIAQLRTELAVRFLAVDYEKIAERKQAIYSAAISDLARISPLVLYAPQVVYNALLVAVCSVYLVRISAPLYAIFSAFMLAVFAAAVIVVRVTRSKFDQMRRAEETFFEHLRTINDGKKEFSLNPDRADHFTAQQLAPAVKKARALNGHVLLGMGLYASWSTFAVNCAAFAGVFCGYTLLHLPSAEILKFVIGGIFIVGPLSFLAEALQPIALGFASLRHLERTGVDLQADVQAPHSPRIADKETTAAWQHLHVDELVYRYARVAGEQATFGVGPVTFTIRRGDIIFFVGGNGSGKSTLLLALCGLLMPNQGGIRLDGRPIHDDLQRYRQLFCGTFSDCFVFRHVLNSAGITPNDTDVMSLLRKFSLDGQVQINNGELSKLTVSAGQRKRLALIQSFFEDRDIYFFDEWAAEQDPVLRDYFYCSVLPDLKRSGKTILVISHDDRYFHLADRIMKLDAGLIVSDTRPTIQHDHERTATPQLTRSAASQYGHTREPLGSSRGSI